MRRTSFAGTVLQRNRASGAIALASAIALPVVLLVAALHGWDEETGFAVYLVYPLVIAGALHLSWAGQRERETPIEVDERGLLVRGALVRRRGSLARARILPRANRGPMVELRRPWDPYPMRLGLADLEGARAFVRALGLDAREGLTRFSIPFATSDGVAVLITIAILLFGVSVVIAPALGALTGPLIVLCAVLVARLLGRTVTIGADGVLVEGGLGDRFVSWSDVRAVERTDGGVSRGGVKNVSPGFELVLKDGARVRLRTLHERLREAMFEDDHLYEEARRAHAAFAGTSSPAAALLRGERSVADWVHALRRDGIGYRVSAPAPEVLLRVALDATASEEARAGAAVALAARDPDARARLRVGAEGIATPRLRAAVIATLDEDDEALELELERLTARAEPTP